MDDYYLSNLKPEVNMGIVDFSVLENLAGGDKQYFSDVINIFIDTTSASIERLNALVLSDDNHMEISAVAHSIKSGVGIVQVKGLLDELIQIEKLAQVRGNMPEVREHIKQAVSIYKKALPVLLEKK